MSDDATLVGEGRSPRREAISLARGDQVGRYLVLDQLGRGGMGVVYSAFDPTLDRKVALKVLLAAPDEPASEGQPRLLREAQALAKLSHPNVITVHDVGTVGDAVFIAMEFIDGVTLTRWCEMARPQGRPWREVVAVLIAAGRGIAAAHRAKMIHRDFKPDNVMIGADGRPRVLDFGLARAAYEGSGVVEIPAALDEVAELGVSSTFDAKLTETGAIMGTPAYMAPEQHAGGRVDERSDQFAFCVTAYEALYGERPFGGETHAALAFQVTQGLVRDAPKGTEVPGWLRKVLLRGLAVAAEDRWPSMDELLRALARDPARRRRRAGAIALGMAAVAGLALGVAELLDEPPLCAGASQHLVGVWDDEARARVAEAFTATRLDYADDTARAVTAALDEYAEGWTRMRTEACEATRIRGDQSDEILTLRMACLDRHLAQLDALVHVYREADAEVLERAVEASASLPPLRLCADVETLRAGVRPPQTEALAEQVEALRARVDAASSLELAGKRVVAREQLAALHDEVLALDYRPLTAEYLLAYGPTIAAPEPRAEALEQAVWMAEASHHDRVAAQACLHLVETYGLALSKLELAELAVERSSAAIARLGDDPDLRVRLDVAHGLLLDVRGESEPAVELLRRAHAERVRLGQAGTPIALQELVPLANALMDLGRHDEAGPLLQDALVEARAQLGEGHPWTARLQSTLARAHYQAGDMAAAEAALREALVIFERSYGPRSQQVSSVLNGLGLTLWAMGRREDALVEIERALDLTIEISGPESLPTAQILGNLAGLQGKLGHHDRSVELFERSVAIMKSIHGTPNIQVALEIDDLGSARRHAGQLDRAEAEFRASYEMMLALDDETVGPRLAYPLTGLGKVALDRGDPARARPLLEQAWALTPGNHELLGPTVRANIAFALARALDETGAPTRARELAEQALSLFEDASASYAEQRAEVEAWLATRR